MLSPLKKVLHLFPSPPLATTVTVMGEAWCLISALDSGSSGPGFESRPGTLCCVLGEETLLSLNSVPLTIQMYEWVLANLMLGVTLPWTSIPSREGRGGGWRVEYSKCFMLLKTRKCHLGFIETFSCQTE